MIPADGPNNLEIQIDDLNRSQMVAGGINASRWPSYIQDMVRVLRPGGWCQMVEVYFNAQSDNGTLDQDHALSKWSREYLNTVHQHKDPRAAMHLASWMRNAGLTEVESRLLTLPMSAWPSEDRQQEIGALNSEVVAQLLHSLALYPLIQLRGMPPAEVQDLIERAKTEAGSRSLKAYFPLFSTGVSEASQPPPPPLLLKLKGELKTAMRAKDTPRLNILRAILAANTNASKTKTPITTDVQVVSLMRKLHATTAEAAAEARAADRQDLVEAEEKQMAILAEFIAGSGVETLGKAELNNLIQEAIDASRAAGTATKAIMGDVMKRLAGALEGKDVDRKEVRRIIEELTG
ncbi:hypothetical protein CDD80_744 [Ophiocordyceps camponoti-rufipedis]|uniref:Altered inheritance of mitochondria protein 41 n=1 Tax=Ophiocordyceps camponoti-rufipedis TaxID=2004952 RepID=A0A2C5ZCZ3_9HYPO|nr:hypothetical protein CDD80_744 [Ophiocordyceps camponoti-rufipedis]